MKNWALLIFVSALAACSSTSSTIVLSPNIPVAHHKISTFSPISVQVIDQRSVDYIVNIDGSDPKNRTLSSSESLKQLLQHSLVNGFEGANVALSHQAPVSLTFYLDKLLVNVKQNTFDYNATTSLVLRVKGNSPHQTFTKDYKVSGSMNGAFKLEHSDIEKELNNLIDKLTTDIINDDQLQDFLSKQ